MIISGVFKILLNHLITKMLATEKLTVKTSCPQPRPIPLSPCAPLVNALGEIALGL